MVEINTLLPLARTAAFGAATLLSLVVFCLSAHLLSLTTRTYRGAYFEFTAVGIAAAILTIISLPPMWVIALKRKGAFTSYIAAEIGWCWFLWVMWVATGGSAASLWGINSCRSRACSEAQIVEAFGFLNWFILMAYTFTLLILSVMAHTRGHSSVWTSEVGQFDWSAPNVQKHVEGGVVGLDGVEKQYTGSSMPSQQTAQFAPNSLPQQLQYPPQGVPPPQPPVPNAYVGAPAGAPMSYTPQV